ncbi:hypothetical protein ABZS66_19215 [Dactylosporangium sp. NPDC005572]|uniref:hypothetical protein n=1 Tax=Dactylosporangium sp. NPDC005572 TaxID=3156889 RepID=UPI0033AA71FE
MGRRFNGSSDFLLMNIGSVLGTLDGGPRTFAYIARLFDQTDGAVIHTRIGSSTANNDQCWWVEHAGNAWNYGTRVAARDIGDAPIGDLAVFVVRKADGGSAFPRGRVINLDASSAVTDVTAGTSLPDNDAPGVTGQLRIGQWPASEFLNADLFCLATWNRELSDAETLDLDPAGGATWADWLDAGGLGSGLVGAWPFNQATSTDPVPDDSGNGATSSAITGTTIVAEPAALSGFFTAGNPPVVLGQAVESDTAAALTRTKRRSLGQATETSTANPLTRSKRRAIGQAIEVDTGGALTRVKLRLLGQAVENDTGMQLARSKRTTLGGAVETDTARPLTLGGAVVLGQAIDTQLALPLSTLSVVVLGQAVETSSASVLGRSKRRSLGQAAETDTANAVTAPSHGRPVVARPNTGRVIRPDTGRVIRP